MEFCYRPCRRYSHVTPGSEKPSPSSNHDQNPPLLQEPPLLPTADMLDHQVPANSEASSHPEMTVQLITDPATPAPKVPAHPCVCEKWIINDTSDP